MLRSSPIVEACKPMQPMLPYFHPTTCLVVDDDTLFLESFAHRYGAAMLCATESNPKTAIQRLRAQTRMTASSVPSVHSPIAALPEGLSEDGEALFRVETSSILQIARRLERFSHLSVIIIDYAMPAMSGLDVCRSIKDLPVKKILLTGMAGDSTAVDAFNEGLIDFFLVKQDARLSERLPVEVDRLQREYFAQRTVGLEPVSRTDDAAFLRDPALASWLEQLSKDVGAVEHYLMTTTPGLMLVDQTGKATLAYVFSADRMRAQREIAVHEGAPAALIARLEAGKTLLVCPSETGFYDARFAATWPKYVHDAVPVSGASAWQAAVNRASAVDLRPASLRHYRSLRRGA